MVDPICDIGFIIDNMLYIIADNLATKFVCFPLAFIFKIESLYPYVKNSEPFTKYYHTETKPRRAHSTKANRYKSTF